MPAYVKIFTSPTIYFIFQSQIYINLYCKKTWEVKTPHVLASMKLINVTQEVLKQFADQHLLELRQQLQLAE
jgi:hypothetical protein